MTESDKHHLTAARGWLELGLFNEAFEELDEIGPQARAHLDVIKTRWQGYRAVKKWAEAEEVARGITTNTPKDFDGWWMLSFALHGMKRTQEAYDNLAGVRDKFPGEFIVHYNLACYATQLSRLDEARVSLKRAFELNPGQRVEALEDPDLEPFWAEIQKASK